jgi:protein tyrosine/serine phosphatase
MLGLLIGAFAWAWNSAPLDLKDRLFPKHLVEVEPGWLWRSGQIESNLIEPTLRDLGIDLVVDLTHAKGDRAQAAELEVVDRLGIERVSFPLGGSGTGSIELYAAAVTAIARAEREGRQVLVHCRAGDRRTGGVIAVYQLLVKGEPAERAREEVERFKRSGSTTATLESFLDESLPEIAKRLVESGVIVSVPDPLPRLGSP